MAVVKSGSIAAVGTLMESGFNFCLDQHGGSLGGRKVELVTVDEGESPQTGVAAVTRLVQQEQVDVLVGVTTGPTLMGSRDIIDANQVPTLLGNSGSVVLGGAAFSKWMWRGSQDNFAPGRVLATHLAANPDSGDFFLIGADFSGGHEIVQGFKDNFPADRIVGEVYTPFGATTDFSPYLAQIRASGAKNVFAMEVGSEGIEFVKQFEQFGLSDSVKLYGPGVITEPYLIPAQGPAALGVLNSSRYNWDLDNPQNKNFAPAYEAKTGKVPSTEVAVMYDMCNVLDVAIGAIRGDVTRQAINEAIGNVDSFEGVRGKFEFDDRNTIIQEWVLTEVQETDKGIRNVTLRSLGSSAPR
jgi:branched-chain amino acid transport system substrate-binding protein